MAVKNIFSIYAASIDGLTIPVTQQNVSPGIQAQVLGVNGQIDPTFVFVGAQSPSISFSTPAIKAVLDKIATPWQSYEIVTAATFYLQKHIPFGGRSLAADFQKFNVTDGILVPRPLSAGNGQAASMGFDLLPVSTDGEALPITHTTSVANPALGVSAGDAWTAGPIKINTASLDANNYTGVQSIEIDPGIGVEARGGDGAVFSTHVSVNAARPTIRVTLSDAMTLSQLGLSGLAQDTFNDSTIFLRKIQPNGTRVPLATLEHISIAIDDGIITPDPLGGAHGTQVTSSLVITPVFDGTTPQLMVNTATAIS
ncbi:MAG: hypothetical protein ACE5EX_00125 [Phycisphaerae bacterium]